MKIAIISDVHDHLRLLAKAIQFFNTMHIDLLIHCGDWDMPFSMRPFAKAHFPIRGVLGNGDPDIQKFMFQLEKVELLKNAHIDIQPKMQDFMLDGKRICVFHGDDEQVNKLIIESQLYDLYCTGHNHTYSVEQVGRTLVVNPGSFVGYKEENGIEPVYAALYDSTNSEVTKIDLEKIR